MPGARRKSQNVLPTDVLMLEAAVSKSIDERVRLIEEFIVDTTLGRLYPVDIVEECRSIMKPPQNFNLYVVAGQAFD